MENTRFDLSKVTTTPPCRVAIGKKDHYEYVRKKQVIRFLGSFPSMGSAIRDVAHHPDHQQAHVRRLQLSSLADGSDGRQQDAEVNSASRKHALATVHAQITSEILDIIRVTSFAIHCHYF